MVSARVYPLVGAAWEQHEPVWTELLSRSENASPFLDWTWLKLWWKQFGPTSAESAHLCIAYDGSEPIGALPVVVGPARRKPGIDLLTVQTLGSRLFDPRNIFSEYLGLACPPSRECEARDSILCALWNQFQPGEFVVGWTKQGGQWVEGLSRLPGAYVRIASRERSYQADLSRGFIAYAGSLGASTRRSLLHLRSRLEGMGIVSVAQSTRLPDALDALDDLNGLHVGRWGSPAFSGRALEFHRQLISQWLPLGRIALSRMLLNGRCVSCLYDLRLGTTQYNIQLGFNPAFNGKLSLGLLHLGYAMEEASNCQIQVYDFLAGRGRRSNYKAHLASTSQEVAAVQALTGTGTTTLYRLIDFLRGGGRSAH